LGSFWGRKHGPGEDGSWICGYTGKTTVRTRLRWALQAKQAGSETCGRCGRPVAGTEGSNEWEDMEESLWSPPINVAKEVKTRKAKRPRETRPSSPPDDWWDPE
jgi:hypothetical protein